VFILRDEENREKVKKSMANKIDNKSMANRKTENKEMTKEEVISKLKEM
jgi:hypothetical protein